MLPPRLIRYALRRWPPLSAAIAAMLLSVGFSVVLPWPAKLLIDNVIGAHSLPDPLRSLFLRLPGPHDRFGLLVWITAATVAAALGTALSQIAKTYAITIFGQRVTFDVASDAFVRTLRLSQLVNGTRPTGDTLSRITVDSYCVYEVVNGALLVVVQAVITVAAIFVIMWNLSPPLALASLGVVPLLGIAGHVFGKAMKRWSRLRRDLEGGMASIAEQAITALPAVQSFMREDFEGDRFRRAAHDTVHAYKRATIAETSFSLAVAMVIAISSAAIMFVGGYVALHGAVSAGTIVLFLIYLQLLYQPFTAVTGSLPTIQLASAEADRIMEILETPVEIQDAPGARDMEISGHIQCEDIHFGYKQDVPVLNGISLAALPGQVVAIVGPTGAGKSTLASMLDRFFDPWEGRILIDGVDIRDLTVRCVRGQIAMVLQDPYILPLTVAENIAYGRPDAGRDKVIAAALAANADEFIRRLPHGYDTVVGERGATLSGGEKQRLAIARAFLKDAPILILDEPTSALDAHTESRLLESLRALMRGRTTIVIAHRLSTIRNADRILVMDHGEIVESGRHADLMVVEGMYAGMYRQQMDHARHDAERAFPVDELGKGA